MAQYRDFFDADSEWREPVKGKWGEKAARHLHFEDGFTYVVTYDSHLVGLISIQQRPLPMPLTDSLEGYIDIIEVDVDFRRKGIASRLVKLSCERARAEGAFQIRAWSSEDKVEALPFWRSLGFGLVPAVTYTSDVEIRGFYVVKVLAPRYE